MSIVVDPYKGILNILKDFHYGSLYSFSQLASDIKLGQLLQQNVLYERISSILKGNIFNFLTFKEAFDVESL